MKNVTSTLFEIKIDDKSLQIMVITIKIFQYTLNLHFFQILLIIITASNIFQPYYKRRKNTIRDNSEK